MVNASRIPILFSCFPSTLQSFPTLDEWLSNQSDVSSLRALENILRKGSYLPV
jgi:hypothetical protein